MKLPLQKVHVVESIAELMTKTQEEFYHGWTIQVAQEQVGYTFQCCVEQTISVTDAQNYLTLEHAFRAGRLRADLESVRLSLTTFLRGKLQLMLLHSDERNALENSIAQYIDTANQRKH